MERKPLITIATRNASNVNKVNDIKFSEEIESFLI